MNNERELIETLAIELGHTKSTFTLSVDNSKHEAYILDSDDLKAIEEAYARATLQTKPVAWRYKYTAEGDWMLSKEPTCEADLQWLKATYKEFEIHPLFTLPPSTVPVEKYNKLLDALRFYADKNHVNFGDNLNKNFPNVFAMKYVPISGGEYPACIENGEVARQAIAEAEGKEG